METISLNKQLLQEDSRGTEKSDTELARRQEKLRGLCYTKYSRPPKQHTFLSLLLALDFHSATAQIANSRNAIPAFTVSFPDPGPQSCSFSSPFQMFPQSLSLQQVFHSTARKEADISNFKILARPLCILSAWNLQVSKQGLPHGASPFKHLKKKNTTKTTNQHTQKPPNPKYNTLHFFLTVVFK